MISYFLSSDAQRANLSFSRHQRRTRPLYFFLFFQGEPDTRACVIPLDRFAKENDLELLVVGKGSNILFDDRGFDGIVVVNKMCYVEELEEGMFRVGGGMHFDRLGWLTSRRNFSGLEFATGIPGTVGGAIFMNAGANAQVNS